ncbi:MAG: hypothetical protein U0237_11565 [Thermoleophilia bacterium]
MPTLEITDEPTIHLRRLLELIQGETVLRWSILELWATAKDATTDLLTMERLAAASPTGLMVGDSELRQIASKLSQVIDGIFVGFRGDPPARSATDLRAYADVVIEAFDSTYWRVHARHGPALDGIRHAGYRMRELVPEPAIPATHRDT